MPIILTDENFAQEIHRTDKLVLVDFYSTLCEPCSLLAPILEKLEKEFEEKIVLLKANVDETQLHAQKFQVERIPMVILFKNGEPINAFTGLRPESILKEWLEKMIQDNMPPESSANKQNRLEEMIKKYSEYAHANGFQLNPDKKNVERVINGLLENEKKKGKRYCPCRRLSGDQAEDAKKVCPCVYHQEEIAKDGRCFCGLFTA
jgi:thioredoxin